MCKNLIALYFELKDELEGDYRKEIKIIQDLILALPGKARQKTESHGPDFEQAIKTLKKKMVELESRLEQENNPVSPGKEATIGVITGMLEEKLGRDLDEAKKAREALSIEVLARESLN